MTLIKLKEKEGDPESVLNQLRSLMVHFKRLVEDDGLVKRFWGHVSCRMLAFNSQRTGPCYNYYYELVIVDFFYYY